MSYKITKSGTTLKGELKVPASKSISNRLLIIREMTKEKFRIENLSESEDTRVLLKALQNKGKEINIGHAGTSMRFLTAYYASRECEKILTGSERMKNRPIGKLVDTLKKLGANIQYLEKDGYPPIQIKGRTLEGGSASIDSSVSSQFISALLMVAPSFSKGLELQLENSTISSSYISMTLQIMEHMGVKAEKRNDIIKIEPQEYIAKDITVEGDWSGVSYWYQCAAFASEADIFIRTLNKNSFQGDAHCADIFRNLGIETTYLPEGIRITKKENPPPQFDFDFIENPDLVQTMAVTCVMLGVRFRFSGTQSLRIKETDRIAALQNELAKFGAKLEYTDGILKWDGSKNPISDKIITIATYDDHRMALSFAPIALLGYQMIIEHPEVVVKSYPDYWEDLKSMGFQVENI